MAALPALFGLLMAVVVTGQNLDITPREAVRRVGDDLTVLCKVPYPIDACRMTVGTTSYRLIPNNQEEEIVYAGQGLQHGECGAHIKHIKEEWNGNISCTLPPQTGQIEVIGTMRLLVAKAPANPQLISPPQPAFREGDGFMAQCIVPNGRPAAKITWYLDEVQLLAGIHQPVITSEPGSDLKTISQNVSRTLAPEDNGQKLVCRAEHEALDGPREAARQLVVHYPPKRLESGPITIFGLKLGGEGRLNVTIRANPAPTTEWTVGDLVLIPPRSNEDGSITALEPLHLGGGFYNVTLVLARVAKEDVERTYYLRVTNDLGREEFAVRLSTMDEPAARKSKTSYLIIDVYGVELETGAIVGIVIAVLILLIAIILVVFAKATGRWFFAGSRGRDHTKSSGESTPAGDVLLESGTLPSRTDTESAAGQRSRLSALSARVRAVLPRGRDRVQATEPIPEVEDKALAEEKKGVVYAELALGDQNAEKPPPPSTEYAEIVYTDQPAPVKEAKE
ncbi:fasciclin-3 isoform X2 [Bicyclus anynana]|uniref:Fasciclin-3 isoform X2 n=1 Tax=Bicyclus anynana TaxID=110368 RepID=A0ABM3LIX5_BICAN|nr:fasciclin-3 isoform X2 [Bicyclus anynana]